MRKPFIAAVCLTAVFAVKLSAKKGSKASDWSNYKGKMPWKDALKKCKKLGMRLPTIEEFEAAYKNGVTKRWKEQGIYYLDFRAFRFDVYFGDIDEDRQDIDHDYVRCIR